MRVLLVGPTEALPDGVREQLAHQDWAVQTAPDYTAAADKARSTPFDALITVAPENDAAGPNRPFQSLLRYVDNQRTATIVLGTTDGGLSPTPSSLIEPVDRQISGEELARRLTTLTRYQRHVRRMEQELDHLQRLGKRLNEHFQHVDEEMRLAASLQRDFFPPSAQMIGPLRFASLNRPASWVSGDGYDVFRVDERHVGFYIVDVVGHGMAAGLLTMFIKHAMVGKRITSNSYEVLEPSETLRRLNDALRQHTLPKCQFVTVVYCLVDIETLVMKYARGGHPYPLLFDRDGQCTELKASGGLLGLFEQADYPTEQVQLHRGDKVVLYSDGLEAPLEQPRPPLADPGVCVLDHRAMLDSLGRSGATEMVARIRDYLDARSHNDLPADDTTVLALELADDA